ncbi:MAG: sigma 54-interacting transcriptional regulator [Desulfomonile tiedjei]|nr:sigma 54-interacting transcriptional regulator [Desulfomonile tiedjei]
METPKRILVVDDDRNNLDLLGYRLESLGYEPKLADNCAEALAKLESGVDLVLLDAVMPDMDGFQLAKVIRDDPRFSDIPIIMVTILSGKGDRLRAVESGANDFIAKPIDVLELQVRTAALLRMKEAQDAVKRHRAELETEVERRTAALSESEARFRTVFEAAQDYMFVKDNELRYTHVNAAMTKAVNAEESSIIGKTDEDVFGDDYARQVTDLEYRVLRGQAIETEHTLTCGGLETNVSFMRFPMRGADGRITGICGIGRDITDRSQRESKPRAEAERYPSPAMRDTLEQICLVAKTDSIVLFLGESGSGKDYLARCLHQYSHRASGPFFAINCAALAPELVESELFGHEPGAFTGSQRRKRGLLELAEGGTLLLNEIGELPIRLQSKLLTFLDTQSFVRVGGERDISVNARMAAATNRELKKEVELGTFREDLFYRLNVFSIRVPSLRERVEDLPLLVYELVAALTKKMGLSNVPTVEMTAIDALTGYTWPGNVRELSNLLERALIISDKKRITVRDLGMPAKMEFKRTHENDISFVVSLSEAGSLHDLLLETKRRCVTEGLKVSRGSIKGAAHLLGISRDSFVHHMKSLGIRK